MQIAGAFNRRGITAASGKQWRAMQVLGARHRLGRHFLDGMRGIFEWAKKVRHVATVGV